jgi:hypothetical protein
MSDNTDNHALLQAQYERMKAHYGSIEESMRGSIDRSRELQ